MVQFRHLLGLGILAGLALLASCTPTPRVDETRQATGVKVGEVTDTSAFVWMRVTEKAERRADGLVRRGRAGEGGGGAAAGAETSGPGGSFPLPIDPPRLTR